MVTACYDLNASQGEDIVLVQGTDQRMLSLGLDPSDHFLSPKNDKVELFSSQGDGAVHSLEQNL